MGKTLADRITRTEAVTWSGTLTNANGSSITSDQYSSEDEVREWARTAGQQIDANKIIIENRGWILYTGNKCYKELPEYRSEKKMRDFIASAFRYAFKKSRYAEYKALAEDNGIPYAKVKRYMSGEEMPTLLAFIAMCDALDVTPNDMLGYALDDEDDYLDEEDDEEETEDEESEADEEK